MGCGDIYVAQSLAVQYPNIKFICIDIAFTDSFINGLENPYKNIYLFSSFEDAKKNLDLLKIDIVLLLDVIEHIEDDITFLKDLQQLNKNLFKDTYWFITVPAYQKLFCKHDVFLRHYRRYTNSSLKKHLKEANLKPIVLYYFFFSLLFPRILKVLIEKINHKANTISEKGIGQWNKNKLFTKCIHYCLLIDFKISNVFYKLFKLRLPGLSNFCICKSVS